jgi:hypothetical protein
MEGAMKVVPLAMILALLSMVLAGPAFAQGLNLVMPDRGLTNEEIERNKAIDEAYQNAKKKIPEQKPSSDPWGNVRASGSSSQPAAPAKPAQQKTTKTQSTVR